MTLKAVEQGKRSAEGSPDNVPSRKRAAFGDITNVSLVVFCGEMCNFVAENRTKTFKLLSFDSANLIRFFSLVSRPLLISQEERKEGRRSRRKAALVESKHNSKVKQRLLERQNRNRGKVKRLHSRQFVIMKNKLKPCLHRHLVQFQVPKIQWKSRHPLKTRCKYQGWFRVCKLNISRLRFSFVILCQHSTTN